MIGASPSTRPAGAQVIAGVAGETAARSPLADANRMCSSISVRRPAVAFGGATL